MKKVKLDQTKSKPQEYENTFPNSSNKKYSNIQTSNVSEIQTNPLHRKFSNDVEKKLLAMSPMNLFFNKVKSSPKTHNDKRSLYFTDLLHPSLGNLQSSLQIKSICSGYRERVSVTETCNLILLLRTTMQLVYYF